MPAPEGLRGGDGGGLSQARAGGASPPSRFRGGRDPGVQPGRGGVPAPRGLASIASSGPTGEARYPPHASPPGGSPGLPDAPERIPGAVDLLRARHLR